MINNQDKEDGIQINISRSFKAISDKAKNSISSFFPLLISDSEQGNLSLNRIKNKYNEQQTKW